ncbi:hypothetical protein K490DRAFT_67798 [Saccharata proteae CBS 121410]|uniref:Uncharacterized protein n=1 Tax=Saccharata proteae CBS 121410 TaxID=1314787 RepID=A0A9P4LUX5_9PEZI|nr:hypothetical protein K490DRAFT_67798 [Saccharata proteae CBS 121410]
MPASPGTPLFSLSPERVNGIRPPYNGSNPASPTQSGTLGSPLAFIKSSHSRSNSDANVHGMVARFNSLEIRDHKELHRRDEVAIKRAEMAREMAELDAKKAREERAEMEKDARKIKEEARRYKKEIEEGRERERRAAKRLEVMSEELHRNKETHNHAQSLYEKEIRKSRKEAFKSSSALVKLQEELKATRNSLRITQSGLESEKLKLSRREQEAFTAQYQLVGVQEELQKQVEKNKVMEAERDALKTSLKEEEVARIAAEGRIALPVSHPDEDDEFASPRRSPTKMHRMDGSDKENEIMMPKRHTELKSLHEDLDRERRRRERAEDTIEFMKMECQFQCCSCRVAEHQGDRYIYDDSFEAEIERIKAALPTITPPASEDEMTTTAKVPAIPIDRPVTPPMSPQGDVPEEPTITFSPTSGTFKAIPSPERVREPETAEASIDSIMEDVVPAEPSPAPESIPEAGAEAEEEHSPSSPAPEHPFAPHTPLHREIRTITTTTTIPIAFSPAAPATVQHIQKDLPFDREAALAQIRMRRGRARSLAENRMTPRKQMIEGANGRRDVSAPALR